MQDYFDYQCIPHALYAFPNVKFINLRRKNTKTPKIFAALV